MNARVSIRRALRDGAARVGLRPRGVAVIGLSALAILSVVAGWLSIRDFTLAEHTAQHVAEDLVRDLNTVMTLLYQTGEATQHALRAGDERQRCAARRRGSIAGGGHRRQPNAGV
jgi:hypothetical protein